MGNSLPVNPSTLSQSDADWPDLDPGVHQRAVEPGQAGCQAGAADARQGTNLQGHGGRAAAGYKAHGQLTAGQPKHPVMGRC